MQFPEARKSMKLWAAGWRGIKRKLEEPYGHFVFEIDFMVKLLRACVWMPWRKQAMKDVVSCDKPREDANSL